MSDLVDNRIDPLLQQQRFAWSRGERVAPEQLCAADSAGYGSEILLDLIYNEIILREELGESPSESEYQARYPEYSDEIVAQFEVHRALGTSLGGLSEFSELTDFVESTNHDTPLESSVLCESTVTDADDYEIIHPLGRGGMGIVTKARHRPLRRLVALKTFRPGRLPTARERVRFRIEAEATARLRHPHIVQIYEIGERDGSPYLALELVEGGTLADRLSHTSFAPRVAAELVLKLAAAVAHAHECQVVHRDLKPTNILFTNEGTPKIVDFGLAKILEEGHDHDATRSDEPVGTPRYMAPEQASGDNQQVGMASDIHALGLLLYECLTGRAPFLSPSVAETLEMIRKVEPTPPRRLHRGIPRDLETITLRCLEKEPARRYATAAEVAEDLERYLQGEPILARPIRHWERLRRWGRRRPGRAAAVVLFLLLAVTGSSMAGIREIRERQRLTAIRSEVEELVADGRASLEADDDVRAEERFRLAWIKVQGEPALASLGTGVSGWLDHGRRAALRQVWRRRTPPTLFEDRREEATILAALTESRDAASIQVAHAAIADAMEATTANDPAWESEREQLILLDSLLTEREHGARAAYDSLATVIAPRKTTLGYRAELLEKLGRAAESASVRQQSAELPPDGGELLLGIGKLQEADYPAAAKLLERLLEEQPESFTARLLLGICHAKLGRPAEAKVAFTACIAQRPRSIWARLHRARVSKTLGDTRASQRDIGEALALEPNENLRSLLQKLGDGTGGNR